VKLVDFPVKKLPILVDKFPNAVALLFNPAIEWDEEVEVAIQSLARLTNLEAVELDEVFYDMGITDVLPFCDSLGEALGSCHRLHSLNVVLPAKNAEAGMCLYSHLSHLTGLTHLDLRSGWEQLVKDPYAEVRNIKDLGIQSVCLQNGQLVFPSLTHVTRLSVHSDVKPADKFRRGVLEMILPYAPNLQSLKVRGAYDWDPAKVEWALFSEFRHLASLEFEILHGDVAQDFYAALDCLNLTHLGFNWCQLSADCVEKMAGVRSLTSLRSFSFKSCCDNIYEMFAAMPHLTRLHMWSITIIEPLTLLTGLRDLEFHPRFEALSNLPHVFSLLSNLESLSMKSHFRGISSFCFSHLKNLRSLSLEALPLDGDIFCTLAQLSGLTQLKLRHCDLPFSSTLSGLNALTNLKRLELWNVGQAIDQMSILMEGKLCKLRYLTLTSNKDDDVSNQWRSLYQSLPDLRECWIRDPVYDCDVYKGEFE